MTRSYTADEWMGLEPVYSPAIRSEPDNFDWDTYEKRQREEEARIFLDTARHQIFPILHCHICNSPTQHTLIARDDDPDLDRKIAEASANVVCWKHERKK